MQPSNAATGFDVSPNSGDFGGSVSLSADGNTLAIGAVGEDSSANGVDGNQADSSAPGSGAVYVFARDRGAWVQQAYIKSSRNGADDEFGTSVALSADGNTLAVGATGEVNRNGSGRGAVYVFVRSGETWVQQVYLKPSAATGGSLGSSVALSGDGNTLAVGAADESGAETGIDGTPAGVGIAGSGAVYVFTRIAETWQQEAHIKAQVAKEGEHLGVSVALAADGNTLAVGAGGDAFHEISVAVYLFARDSGTWSEQRQLEFFGPSVALSADGNTLATGAADDRDSTGINPSRDEPNKGAPNSGAAFVFTRSEDIWTRSTYIKASNTDANDRFGHAIALSADGNNLLVGAPGRSAVYVLSRDESTWTQRAYVIFNPGGTYYFGSTLALSGDASTFAIRAWEMDKIPGIYVGMRNALLPPAEASSPTM